MKKTLCLMLVVSFFLGCGPQAQTGANSYFSYPPEASKISDAGLLPFEQIKAPKDTSHTTAQDSLQKAIAQTAADWRLGRYEFPRPYPYLVSASPFYCDPQRFPPSLVLSMYACQPYIPQIMQMGFYHSERPGF